MIELVEGLPDNVVGLMVKGRLTAADCTRLLLPAVNKAQQRHRRLRLYYEIRSRYPGAAWEEVAFGFEPTLQWERIAIVSDAAWLRHIVQALRLVLPGEVRVFAGAQTPEARTWIADRPAVCRRRRRLAAPRAATMGGRALIPAPQFLHLVP